MVQDVETKVHKCIVHGARWTQVAILSSLRLETLDIFGEDPASQTIKMLSANNFNNIYLV